jgi:hypothetical protein
VGIIFDRKASRQNNGLSKVFGRPFQGLFRGLFWYAQSKLPAVAIVTRARFFDRPGSILVRFMSRRVTIQRLNGIAVCEIEARLEGPCGELKQQISDYLGICKCKFKLVAGTHVVLKDGLYVKRILRFIEPDLVLQLIEQPVVLTCAADLFASGVCFKCMREVGVQVHEIFALPRLTMDVAALRRAGFSLEDMVRARAQLPLAGGHPPPTRRTLFDSQLKAGGFSARDFAMAGYQAERLSYNWFWKDGDDTYAGDADWEDCYAFFTASELRSAGYDASALRRACFSTQDLKEAGFSLLEVTEAGCNKRDWEGDERELGKRRKSEQAETEFRGWDGLAEYDELADYDEEEEAQEEEEQAQEEQEEEASDEEEEASDEEEREQREQAQMKRADGWEGGAGAGGGAQEEKAFNEEEEVAQPTPKVPPKKRPASPKHPPPKHIAVMAQTPKHPSPVLVPRIMERGSMYMCPGS